MKNLSQTVANQASNGVAKFLALTKLRQSTDARVYCDNAWLKYLGEVSGLQVDGSTQFRYGKKRWKWKHTEVRLPFKACSEDNTLDAFHLTEEYRVPRVILCKQWLEQAGRRTVFDEVYGTDMRDRLENYAGPGPGRHPVIPVLLLDDVFHQFLAPALARELLLTGINYGGRPYPSYDHNVNYNGQVEIARGFELCRELARQSPDQAATDAHCIILFGLCQTPRPPQGIHHEALSLGL